jgi:hypothetical protein
VDPSESSDKTAIESELTGHSAFDEDDFEEMPHAERGDEDAWDRDHDDSDDDNADDDDDGDDDEERGSEGSITDGSEGGAVAVRVGRGTRAHPKALDKGDREMATKVKRPCVPVVAILGRPNVGKSMIANRVSGKYLQGAIVHDEVGKDWGGRVPDSLSAGCLGCAAPVALRPVGSLRLLPCAVDACACAVARLA